MNDKRKAEQIDPTIAAKSPGSSEDEPTRVRDEQETIPPQTALPGSDGTEAMPERFGRYRIVKELGRGGMGAVYLAEDTELRRQVALKIPTFPQGEDPELLERFYREARAAATLNHTNICQVYDIGEHEGMRYIAMAYVSGPTLSKLVGSPKLRSERTIAKVVRKIAVGLAQAHGKGILHRDLKPANIILDERNEPVITDFGLARRVESSADEPQLTQAGQLLGTPSYMSPEQVSGEPDKIGPASDVYSLGVILYELLTGERPYKGPIVAVIGQILDGKPKPPSALRAGVDKRLEAICLKMMSGSVDKRYSSAQEAAVALSHFLEQTAADGQSTVSQVASPQAKLEEQKRQAIELLKQGNFKEATGHLQKLAAAKGDDSQQYAEWANAELARLKAMPKDVFEKGSGLVGEAIKLLAQQDYAQVIKLLEPVPQEYRSTEASQVLKQAQDLAAEADQLNERMKLAVRNRDYDGIRENVLERLLELEPGNLMARDIYEHLGTYGPDEKLLFDKRGMLIPARGKYWWIDHLARMISQRVMRRPVQRTKTGGRRKGEPESVNEAPAGVPFVPIAIGVGILGLVGLLLWGTVLILRTPKGTVVVEIDEPNAVVSVDDGKLEFNTTEDDQSIEIKLKKGEHTVTVAKEGFESQTRQLLVKRGQTETIRIDLASVSIQESGKVPTTPVVAQPGGTPSLAIAPFDGDRAKKHQQAWAEYLGLSVERDFELPGGEKLTLVLIPPGEFLMGSTAEEQARFLEDAKAAKDQRAIDRVPREGPQHRVRISRPSYLGKYEVTQTQWEAVMGNNPSEFTDNPSHPVEQVSWDDIQPFLTKLNEGALAEEMRFTLPTEAEWEYACRAGTTTFWHSGDSEAALQEHGWSNPNSGGKTHPVGQLRPNAFGLCDLHGNVWEWCADWFAADYYAKAPVDDPSGDPTGSLRVSRGGGWYYHAGFCRSAYRNSHAPGIRGNGLGFRLACEIPSASPGGTTAPASIAKQPATKPVPAGPPDAATLLSRWTFSEPVNLGPIVNTSDVDARPHLSADGLTLFFDSTRPGGQGKADLWFCTRASVSESFGEPVNLGPIVNSNASDSAPHLSADGLALFFASTRPGGRGMNDLWMCARASVGEPFEAPTNLGPTVNTDAHEANPTLSADGRTLVLDSNRPGGQGEQGDYDLWMCTRVSARESFGKPVNPCPPNSDSSEGYPGLSSDGLTLVFTPARPGGQGDGDLWMCTRPSVNHPFGQPVNLGPNVNSSNAERGADLSADGQTLFFHSDRPGGQGKGDIWMTRIEQRGGPTPPAAAGMSTAEVVAVSLERLSAKAVVVSATKERAGQNQFAKRYVAGRVIAYALWRAPNDVVDFTESVSTDTGHPQKLGEWFCRPWIADALEGDGKGTKVGKVARWRQLLGLFDQDIHGTRP